MGPLAYCCPNSLLSMLILSLPRTRVFLTFLVGTRVSRMSPVYFFDCAAVTGWCVIASFLLSSLFLASPSVWRTRPIFSLPDSDAQRPKRHLSKA
nr:hypothetical protein CFP56_61033 [Quercus suber]